MRKPISKKMRFDVFKRDAFVCQYCGQQPPSVVLEIDHINPVVNGGRNNVDNLVTACFECNRGKGKATLDSTPEMIANKAEIIKERKAQLDAFIKLQKSIKTAEDKHVSDIEAVFGSYFPNKVFSTSFREVSVKRFLKDIDPVTLEGYMHLACSKIGHPENSLSYFCGICWRSIRGDRGH